MDEMDVAGAERGGQLGRRAVLGGLAGMFLAGCSRGRPASGGSSTLRGASTTSPPAGASPDGGAPPWGRLAGRLQGRLVLPADPGYERARLGYDPRYDTVRPAAVAQVAGAQDVQAVLAFASEHAVPFSVRSGGHCYAGWSTGPHLVLDLGRLSGVAASGRTLRVGAGARLVDVYAGAASAGLGIPAGSCPSVGLAGLALGGGVGVLARSWGLTCDAVTAVQVVTADGRIRTADAGHDTDLFWASRGGGGGSFGVVTAFTLAAHAAPRLTLFFLRFPWGAASDVVDAWQHWAPVADRRLWSTCKLLAHPTGDPRVEVSGVWNGSAAGLEPVLASFLAEAGARPTVRSVTTRSYLDAMLAEAGCLHDAVSQCHLPPGGRLERQPFAATSSMPSGPLPAAGVSALVSAVGRSAAPAGMVESGVSLDALGGAVADVSPADTAFVHRDSPFAVQYTATWDDAGRPGAPFDGLVRRLRAALTPFAGNTAYVNYCDAALADWPTAYYGSNLARLREVKRAVDPHNLFTFPQVVLA